MKRLVINSLIAATLCFAASTMFAQNNTEAISIRYDGVYCQVFSGYTSYLRFYEDGTVISMSSTRAVKEEYFDKDNREIQMYLGKGKYEINEGQISFRETTDTGPNAGSAVEYNGQLYSNRLILNSHVIKTGNKSSNREFLFSAWSDNSGETTSSSAQVYYPYTLEQGVNFRVNVSTYKMFYGLVPGNFSPEGYTYQKWGYAGSYSQKNGYIGLPNNSDQKYLELTVWFHNVGDKEAKILLSSKDSTLLDCSLLLGNNQSVPVRAFNFPGAGVGTNRMMIEEWNGDLFFTLKPKEQTWIMILFRIPEDVSEAQFRLKQHTLISVSIPERKH